MKLTKEEEKLYATLDPLNKLMFEYSKLNNSIGSKNYTDKQIEELEAILDKIAKIDEGIAGQLGEGLYSSAMR